MRREVTRAQAIGATMMMAATVSTVMASAEDTRALILRRGARGGAAGLSLMAVTSRTPTFGSARTARP